MTEMLAEEIVAMYEAELKLKVSLISTVSDPIPSCLFCTCFCELISIELSLNSIVAFGSWSPYAFALILISVLSFPLVVHAWRWYVNLNAEQLMSVHSGPYSF